MRTNKYMSNMIKQLVITVSLVGIFSCQDKEEPKQKYTMAGYVYENCMKAPLKNETLNIFQEIESSVANNTSTGGQLVEFTTDANGYFHVEYEQANVSNLEVRQGSRPLIVEIPINADTKNLVLYNTITTRLKIYLQVSQPFTSSDTLKIANFNYVNKDTLLIGPFENKLLFDLPDYLMGPPFSYSMPKTLNVGWEMTGKTGQSVGVVMMACDSTVGVLDVK